MRPMRRRLVFACAALAGTAASGALAQFYPSRPIRLVVPFPPGGVTDPVARMVGERVARSIGQSIVIDNRPGAGGMIGAALVKKAAADGYTWSPARRRSWRCASVRIPSVWAKW